MKRDPHVQDLIDAARGGPDTFGLDDEMLAQDELVLTGAELAAYRRLRAAAQATLAAQDSHAKAGVELRDAIQSLCAVVAPPKA